MADLIQLKRLARRLKERSATTPQNDDLWPVLAQLAADELARTVLVTRQPQPDQRFVGLNVGRESLREVGRTALLTDLDGAVNDWYQGGGTGEVWLVEVKRIVTGA